ncbi:MAG: hypothetical protein AAFQ63_19470 [Cyanobacteria bacterium J06621_11]
MNLVKSAFLRVSTGQMTGQTTGQTTEQMSKAPMKALVKTPAVAFWFGLSFIAPFYFGLISFFYATSFDYIVQDDARLHVVWWWLLVDPELFVGDAIAHYFTVLQPVGFKVVYGVAAALGIEPLMLAKVLPLLLALVSTAYLFWAVLLILPVPMSGFLTTLLLNQNIWIRDDLIAASPRSFVYPLFSAFIYYLLRDSKAAYLFVLGLLGLFYPQMMLVALGVLTLRLVEWKGMKPGLPKRVQAYFAWLLAFVMTLGLLLFFSAQVEGEVGRLTNLAEMRMWPEFWLDGRGEYFGVPLLSFWFDGSSGLRFPLFPPIIGLGVLLPGVIWLPGLRARFPIASYITERVKLLVELLGSALGLFLLAHIIFPVLYLPSRYTFYSSRFVLILASGVMMTLVLQWWLLWLGRQWRRFARWRIVDFWMVGLSGCFAIAVLITPAIPYLFLGGQGWVIGESPSVYEAVASFPKDSMVASLARDVNDNIPAFTRRSVLVGREFSLPFHVEFYGEMRQRAEDLIEAQYSSDLNVVKAFIEKYGVDVWIVADNFLAPDYLRQYSWLMNSLMRDQVEAVMVALRKGERVAIADLISDCSVERDSDYIVLNAECMASWDE